MFRSTNDHLICIMMRNYDWIELVAEMIFAPYRVLQGYLGLYFDHSVATNHSVPLPRISVLYVTELTC